MVEWATGWGVSVVWGRLEGLGAFGSLKVEDLSFRA